MRPSKRQKVNFVKNEFFKMWFFFNIECGFLPLFVNSLLRLFWHIDICLKHIRIWHTFLKMNDFLTRIILIVFFIATWPIFSLLLGLLILHAFLRILDQSVVSSPAFWGAAGASDGGESVALVTVKRISELLILNAAFLRGRSQTDGGQWGG